MLNAKSGFWLLLIVARCRSDFPRLHLEEGDVCSDDRNGRWTCKRTSECSHVKLSVLKPPICSFGDDEEMIVCCPPSKKSNHKAVFGEICKEDSRGPWVCKPPHECTHSRLSESRPSISVCSLQDRAPLICCPPEQHSKAEKACEQYRKTCVMSRAFQESEESSEEDSSSYETDDGFQFPLVVGGTRAKPKSFPEAALLGIGSDRDTQWVCGGSLISDKWILSAAHCESPNPEGQLKWALLGELVLETDLDDARPEKHRIIRGITHPKYRPPAQHDDVALFELERRVRFSEYVAPVCLYRDFHIPHTKGTLIGWGLTDFADLPSKDLLQVQITIVNNSECTRRYQPDRASFPNGIERQITLCAGEREGGKDACRGDSGGPFLVPDPESCLKYQIGIVSLGKQCALPEIPGIYTRVSAYVPWIESYVWP